MNKGNEKGATAEHFCSFKCNYFPCIAELKETQG